MKTMPALTFVPALSWYAMLHAGPLRPLHTFMRTTKDRFQPSRAVRFAPAVPRAEADLLARGVATQDQRSMVLREPGRGRVPTIVLGGFVQIGRASCRERV